MAGDYIPRSDADFRAWLTNFMTYGMANALNLGVTTADFMVLQAPQGTYNTSIDAHVAGQAASESLRAAKDTARLGIEPGVRALVRRLQSLPAVSDAEKQALGITVRDTTFTPSGPPTTRPVAVVDTKERLRHTIRFSDESTPTRKAKPAGVMGTEIWVKVVATGGAPPVNESELTFLAVDTQSPYLAEYEGTDGGKTAHYWLRWISTRGEKGPWSENVNATIGA